MTETKDARLAQIATLAEEHGYDPDAMVAAAEMLAALKATAPEHRMTALAIACRVFCDTDGTLEVKR